MIVVEIYIMSWLISSYDAAKGPVYEMDTVYKLYQVQGILGCSLAFILLGPFGRMSDMVSVRYILPLSLMMRAFICFLTYRIRDPTKWGFFLYVPLLHVTFYATTISLSSYMQKLYPKPIRGMCNSLSSIFQSIGSFFFIPYSQAFFKLGPRLVFLGVTLSDFVLLIIVLILVFFGFFREPQQAQLDQIV